MERKLATIQKIISVESIENADAIEKVSVLGWQCVAKKGEFKTGDLCVYCEIDSILPDKPEFEFLRPRKFRIKTIKLRGVLSQGIVLPLSYLKYDGEMSEGLDVTEIMGVVKYEPYIPPNMNGEVWGERPYFVPKTDEFRIQSYPGTIQEFTNKEVYISTKVDGTSCSIYYFPDFERKFGVCSRNLEIKEDEKVAYWKPVNKYDLKNKLEQLNKPLVLQGEITGPGIQKNHLMIKEIDIYIFDIWFIDERKYASMQEMIDLCSQLGLKTVPVDNICTFNYSMEQLIEMAKGKYSGTQNNREGIVIRPTLPMKSAELGGRLSIKVLNNDYLLKDEE